MNLRKHVTLFAIILLAVSVAACGNLQEQPKLHKPFDASLAYGSAARDPLPEAVAVGMLQDDEHLYTGMVDGAFVETYPFEITTEVIEQGRLEYESYCTPCHGYSGSGDGILSEEGFPPPASYHDSDIKDKPIGSYFNTIMNGQGAMYSYSPRVNAEEAWAIIAYIRVLQQSQATELASLPADLQAEFE